LRRASAALAIWRFVRGLWHLFWGLLVIGLAFPRWSPARREARVQAWARGLLAIWGIELKLHGQPPLQGPVLMVCNHISWLDILVLHAARHVRFVAKADIRRWPVIGPMATGAGTLYIERERRRDAARMVRDMAQALRNGDVLAVFPEGTTSDGTGLLPFHANLLQAAIASEAPVQPLALQFLRPDGQLSHAADYVGDDTLVGSVWRLLRERRTRAVLVFGELQPTTATTDRRALALSLRQTVAQLQQQARAPDMRSARKASGTAHAAAADRPG
jgi:1-acyl-sn-glycerol-3-phosphate acyltransferase